MDRTLVPESRIVWVATAAILVLGALALLWVLSPGERERRRVMQGIEIGTDAERVVAVLGEPAECRVGSLEHLRPSLPEEWPPPATEAAITGLVEETAFRWVYPLESDDPADCAGGADQTEIGLDAERRVLWYVAITGGTSPVLPERYSPDAENQ